ncbi:DedA family protein [Actinoplanes sichuanensis]|uniref:DedA family protein n=1 Tax=Actinoplanes sichuanensis TaxID=512349 RepID=A0ABW4AVU9_9ACTN|nr:DedA family protein [Actinoplanes sichuanensis]BEL10171.1 DedA family protein [Actinoplanes sichuanensis]
MPPSAELPGFLHTVAPILDRWGYLAIGGIIVVESFGVPAPGQTIMAAASVYAGYGRMNIWVVALICFVTAVVGDNIGYWIGLRGGRKIVNRWGKYILVTPARLAKAEQFFAKRGNRVIVIARFIDGLRQLNGVIAGITRMPWKTFLLYNAIGAALWVGFWCTLAYQLGANLGPIMGKIHHYQWPVIGGLVLAVATYVILHVRHIRRRRARVAAEIRVAEIQPAEKAETAEIQKAEPREQTQA